MTEYSQVYTAPRYPAAAINLILAITAFGLCVWNILLWYRYHVHMPWKDTLPLLRDLLPMLDRGLSFRDLPELIAPHYTAHRVMVPRLLLATDISFFSGRGHIMYLAGGLATASVVLMFSRAARQATADQRSLWATSTLAAIVMLAAPANLWNLFNPINISWPLSLALALGALYVLTQSKNNIGTATVLCANLLALAAALTNFAGVLVWLLIPLVLYYRHFQHALSWSILCLVAVAIYTWNIQSDAAIALASTSNTPQTAAFLEDTRVLLDSQTLSTVLRKTIILLAWPLYADYPGLALAVSGFSLFCLGSGALQLVRQRGGGGISNTPWLLYCSSAALLCLGVCLSVYLGRILPYPDTVHGPSPERYQTVVSIYWLHIIGVIAILTQSLHGIPALVSRGVIALLPFILVLLPGSAYLANEFRSLAYAAALFQVGENDNLQPAPLSISPVFTPRYALAFEPAFKARELAWHTVADLPSPSTVPNSCEQMGVEISTGNPGGSPLTELLGESKVFTYLSAESSAASAIFLRDIEIWGSEGRLARLSPVHTADFSPRELLQARHSSWVGAMPRNYVRAPVLARLNVFPGLQRYCRIDEFG